MDRVVTAISGVVGNPGSVIEYSTRLPRFGLPNSCFKCGFSSFVMPRGLLRNGPSWAVWTLPLCNGWTCMTSSSSLPGGARTRQGFEARSRMLFSSAEASGGDLDLLKGGLYIGCPNASESLNHEELESMTSSDSTRRLCMISGSSRLNLFHSGQHLQH